MADTGFIFPGTMVGNRTISGGVQVWFQEDNAKLDDGNFASYSTVLSAVSSFGLAATNFDFSGIPSGATIDGIEIRVGDYNEDSAADFTFEVLRLILADNSDGAISKHADLSVPTSGAQTDEAGGANDLWTESLSRSDVVDADFGFFIGMDTAATFSTINVDFMQMKVFFTPAQQNQMLI